MALTRVVESLEVFMWTLICAFTVCHTIKKVSFQHGVVILVVELSLTMELKLNINSTII